MKKSPMKILKKMIMTKKDLIKFTDEIADTFKKGLIHSPIHLLGGNENQLIKIFKYIKKTDWIFSTWRSHGHWLLSERDPGILRQQILDGHSMHVFGRRFFTSAIVGGIAPIAVGVAYALKLKKNRSKVYCFLGDMSSLTGLAVESIRYACGHKLPITFVVEDNDLSVRTDTLESWGCKHCKEIKDCLYRRKNVCYYKYERKWPHAGIGKKVLF